MNKYIRECDTAMKNKQYFAKCADKERELRLMLRDPKNWLSEFFGREPEMDEEAWKFMKRHNIKGDSNTATFQYLIWRSEV